MSVVCFPPASQNYEPFFTTIDKAGARCGEQSPSKTLDESNCVCVPLSPEFEHVLKEDRVRVGLPLPLLHTLYHLKLLLKHLKFAVLSLHTPLAFIPLYLSKRKTRLCMCLRRPREKHSSQAMLPRLD